jgi:hypothetical protein
MKDVVHEVYRVKRRAVVQQLSLFDAVCPIEDLTVSIEWDGCSSVTNGKHRSTCALSLLQDANDEMRGRTS